MTIADEIQALSDDRTAIQNAISAKGGTVTSADGFDDFANAIATIPSGGGIVVAEQKDVNFIDYDGTILYSYTAAEFAELSAMPNNPAHSGLTAQGWNWTLADAKAYVADYGKLWIGQMYITNDGKTRIYIHLEEGRLSPMLGICINGTVDVDWGDGKTHDTLTGTSLSSPKWTPTHNYDAAGDYVIKLTINGTASLSGGYSTNGGAQLLRYSSGNDYRNIAYGTAITKLEIGSGITRCVARAFALLYSLETITIPVGVTVIGSDSSTFSYCDKLKSLTIPSGVTNMGGFGYCYSLKNISIPNSVTDYGQSSGLFQECRSLVSITLPDSLTTLPATAFSSCVALTDATIPEGVETILNSFFGGCYCLKQIALPDSVTSIGNSVFGSCFSLVNVIIPQNVTSIGSSVFSKCYSLKSIKFESTTPPTVSNSNAWTNVPQDCIIYVPAGSLSAYTSAANYPSSSTYTYVEY